MGHNYVEYIFHGLLWIEKTIPMKIRNFTQNISLILDLFKEDQFITNLPNEDFTRNRS
jgi:hypothetical protein